MTNTKAQGAIEYLLIIGAAILVVAVVIVAITGVLGAGKENANANPVIDEQFKLLLEAAGDSNQIISNEQFQIMVLDKNIYYNGDSIIYNEAIAENAYNQGAFIVKINGTDAKTLGYTYQRSGILLNKKIKLVYSSSYKRFEVMVRHENAINRTFEIKYIGYPRLGETKISASTNTWGY